MPVYGVQGHVLNRAQQVGHVVCIKGISSHFKRWPGFSPPGTPVTHPLVHTPFKEPGTAAPLQPHSQLCVYLCVGVQLHVFQRNIVTELYPHLVMASWLIVPQYIFTEVWRIKSSVALPAPLDIFSAGYMCSAFNKCRHLQGRFSMWCVRVLWWICCHWGSLWLRLEYFLSVVLIVMLHQILKE